MSAAVRRDLQTAGLDSTALGQAAIVLAETIDASGSGSSGMVALNRELRTVLALLAATKA